MIYNNNNNNKQIVKGKACVTSRWKCGVWEQQVTANTNIYSGVTDESTKDKHLEISYQLSV